MLLIISLFLKSITVNFGNLISLMWLIIIESDMIVPIVRGMKPYPIYSKVLLNDPFPPKNADKPYIMKDKINQLRKGARNEPAIVMYPLTR